MPRLSRYGGDSSWIVGCSEVDRVAELSCCKIAKSYAIQAELPRSGSVTDCPVFASWVNFRIARQIGIGAAVTHRPLPHHRAYGSVHGGSSWLR